MGNVVPVSAGVHVAQRLLEVTLETFKPSHSPHLFLEGDEVQSGLKG